MQGSSIYDQGFIGLGFKILDWYLAGRFQLEMIANCESVREGLNEVYNVLVRKNKIVPIEQLAAENKTTIWNDCKPYIEPLSTPERIKFCKCYWALSCLAEKRNV